MKPARFFGNQYFFFICLLLGVASYLWWDKPVAVWVRAHLSGEKNHYLSYLSLPGKAIYPLVLLVLLFIVFKWLWKKPKLAWHMLYLLASVVISGVICDILKAIFGRARPVMLFDHGLYGFQWFQFHARLWSFPSGHCTTVAAVVIGLGLIWPKGAWYFLVLGLIVAASRVLVGAHYPSDALAGFYLGAVVSILLHRSFYKDQYAKQLADKH